MPAHFTHIYAARRVADYLATGEVPEWTQLQALDAGGLGGYDARVCGLLMHKWEKYAATGAIGPDLFYFSQDYGSKPLAKHSDEIMLALTVYFFYNSAKDDNWEPLLKILDDVNSTVGAIVRFMIKLEKIWHQFVSTWESTLGPFLDAASSALDDLTGGVLDAASDALTELKTALITFVQEELLTYKDIFRMFDTVVDKGGDEKDMTWGDTVHYRRTTEIAKNLVAQAEAIRDGKEGGDLDEKTRQERFEQMLAFALGWLTHVATDTIGHSFTNTQCGGPFRNHPQRHHLIENHMDAWNYRHAKVPDPIAANDAYPDLTSSGLAFAVVITDKPGDPTHRPPELPKDKKAATAALRADGEMPDWMADAIVKALIETYAAAGPERGAGPIDYGDDAADDTKAQQDAAAATKAGQDADDPQPTHPLIYGGQDFQASITDNMLISAILDITGHGENAPFNELLDDICPAPDFAVPHGFPLPWQVRTCYKIMLWYYNHFYTTETWSLRKPRKPDPITTPPAQDFIDLLGGPDDSQGPSNDDAGGDICDAIKAAIEWITRVIDAAVKLIGDLIKMLASPGSYLIRLGLYAVAMAVWDITCKIHEILAHTGFAVPHGEVYYDDNQELALGNEIDQQLITVGGGVDNAFRQALADAWDPLGNLDGKADLAPARDAPGADTLYPRYMPGRYTTRQGSLEPVLGPPAIQMPGDHTVEIQTVEYRRPWAYPAQSVWDPKPANGDEYFTNPREKLSGADDAAITVVGPYQFGATPDEVLFDPNDHGDQEARRQYEIAPGPVQTEQLNRDYLTGPRDNASPLGSPVTFSSYLIGQVLNNRGYGAQFNLDSDRAYGYLTWDWDRHHQHDDGDPPQANPLYQAQDDLDHWYQLPITPPQLTPQPTKAGQPTWDGPEAHLKLHYIDQTQDKRLRRIGG